MVPGGTGIQEVADDETLALAGSYKGGVFQRLVAASYKLAPVSDPAALPAFQELARKMARQNDFLRHDYRFIPSSGDHYASFRQLRRSIDAQRQTGKRRADMYVYAEPPGPEGDTSQQGHPVYSNDQNVMIRASTTQSPTSGATTRSRPEASTGPTTGT